MPDRHPDSDLLSLAEVAARLGGVSIKTVKRRCREAGIRGPRPGREMMLTEADYQRLVDATRARSPEPEPAPSDPARSPGEALRALHRRQTRRLADSVRGRSRQVVAIDLERKQ